MRDTSKIAGIVTVAESNTLYRLFKHLNSLEELEKILPENEEALKNKFYADYEFTQHAFQNWWDEMSSKYKFKSQQGYEWEINFETCEIILVKPD